VISFSIIIPVFNASRFLRKCIDSCINQTYKNIEIICVDDGSSDNSKDILLSYQHKDERIHCFFHRQNESQYMARRTGIEHSTGDYILFLDSDDVLRSDACALLEKKIKKEAVDMVQFGYREIPANKVVFSPFYKTSRERIAAYLAKKNRYSPAVWTKAYSRPLVVKAYNSMQVFYASGPEDLYTSIVFACHATSFSFLKKPLVEYSVSTGWSARRVFSIDTYRTWLESYQTVIRKTRDFVTANVPDFLPQCLDMELYLLKDFIFCRIADDLSVSLKWQVFQLLHDYFSEEVIDSFYNELIDKYNMYNRYLNFHCSFFKKIKKLIKVLLLFFKSFIK
jgi:glycosyltransferase involved in cell wall biosynthesis